MYISKDYGVTWRADTSAGNQAWSAITVAVDGSSGAATTEGGCVHLYRPAVAPTPAPTVSPGSLVPICAIGVRPWTGIASSDSGTKLVASDGGGLLYTSVDGGFTWTNVSSLGKQNWTSVASSSNGSVLVGVTSSGQVYTSTDAGVSWTVQTGAPSVSWSSVTSDGAGRVMVATALGGKVWTSDDGGSTWSSSNSPAANQLWSAVDSSSSGSVQIASVKVCGTVVSESTGWLLVFCEGTRCVCLVCMVRASVCCVVW